MMIKKPAKVRTRVVLLEDRNFLPTLQCQEPTTPLGSPRPETRASFTVPTRGRTELYSRVHRHSLKW